MRNTQKVFAPTTSRSARSAATLLAQVADIERGARIKELRKALHLTQPALADEVGVTLRALQEWEAGGGISWDNAKRLAATLGTETDYVFNGERGDTPQPFGEKSQLDRIEAQLADNAAKLDAIQQVVSELSLEALERALREIAQRNQEQDDGNGQDQLEPGDQAQDA